MSVLAWQSASLQVCSELLNLPVGELEKHILKVFGLYSVAYKAKQLFFSLLSYLLHSENPQKADIWPK